MKKNLISIVLIVGAVAFNLSLLCQARCVESHKARQVSVAATVVAEHAVVFCTTHHKGHEVKAEHEGHAHDSGSSIKCGCGVDDPGANLDFNFNLTAVDLAPKGHVVSTIMTADSIFTNIAPVPQDRPPKLPA